MQVVVDRLLTNYEVSGEGKAVLFLHGWGDNIRSMSKLRYNLAKTYRVVALDLPGFGSTQAPSSAWDLSDYVTFVSNFLDKINAPSLLAIVGHSNGGAITIRGLGTGKLSAKKCILMDSSGIRSSYNGRTKLIRALTKTGKALTSPLPKLTKNKLREKVYKTVGSDMLVAEHLQETFKKVVTDDVREDAANINVPTILIYGENDNQTPPLYGREFHELVPDSTLEIVGDAGHFVYLDQPRIVAKLVKDFLE